MQRICSYDEMGLEKSKELDFLEHHFTTARNIKKRPVAVLMLKMYSRYFHKNQRIGPGVFKTIRHNPDCPFSAGDFILILECRLNGETGSDFMLGLLKKAEIVNGMKLSCEEEGEVKFCYPNIDIEKEVFWRFHIERCL